MARPYRSRLRTEQAEHTRLTIRQAARELFERDGFATTTIAAIAERADVAVPTVYSAYRSKGGLVRAMLEEIEDGADQTGWEASIRAETDPARQLGLFIRWIVTLFGSASSVIRAAMQARSDPDVAAMTSQGDANRRAGTTALAEHWASLGVLRSGLAASEAAESLWLLTSPDQFLLATDQLGWSPERYERWVGALAAQVIFGDAACATGPPQGG